MEKIRIHDITASGPAGQGEEHPAFAPDQVGPGKRVTMHFELSLPDGAVIDSNFTGAPASFSVGDGNIMPGFEVAIFGLRPGDETTVRVPADQAFGQPQAENIQEFPRYRFPADLAMDAGLVVNFTDAAGNDQPGVVSAVSASRVTVDFNHPLAGRDLLFRVHVLAVSEQT